MRWPSCFPCLSRNCIPTYGVSTCSCPRCAAERGETWHRPMSVTFNDRLQRDDHTHHTPQHRNAHPDRGILHNAHEGSWHRAELPPHLFRDASASQSGMQPLPPWAIPGATPSPDFPPMSAAMPPSHSVPSPHRSSVPPHLFRDAPVAGPSSSRFQPYHPVPPRSEPQPRTPRTSQRPPGMPPHLFRDAPQSSTALRPPPSAPGVDPWAPRSHGTRNPRLPPHLFRDRHHPYTPNAQHSSGPFAVPLPPRPPSAAGPQASAGAGTVFVPTFIPAMVPMPTPVPAYATLLAAPMGVPQPILLPPALPHVQPATPLMTPPPAFWMPHPYPHPNISPHAFWGPNLFNGPRAWPTSPFSPAAVATLTGGWPLPGAFPSDGAPAAWPPTPSRTDQADSPILLCPWLVPNPAMPSMPHVAWDITQHPTTARWATGRHVWVPLSQRFNQVATYPEVRTMHIHCDIGLASVRWGPIVIEKSSAITLGDILFAIHDFFQRRMSEEDVNLVSSLRPGNRERMYEAFWRRCRTSHALEGYEYRQGMKRADCLQDQTAWWGTWIAVRPDNRWYLNLGLQSIHDNPHLGHRAP